jgi:hypothetical protein
VQDVGLVGQDDPTILEWAAKERRLLVTHDVSTVTRYAYERIAADKPMPGVVEVAMGAPIGVVIEDLLLLVVASDEGEWEGQIRYVPLR